MVVPYLGASSLKVPRFCAFPIGQAEIKIAPKLLSEGVMGIDLALVAEAPKGFLFRAKFKLEEVAKGALKCLPLEAPLDGLYVQVLEGDVLYCRLLPLEQDVMFKIENRRLHVSARTSSLGPGFHAALIARLQALADLGGFEWRETEDEFDETGYFASGDFIALQREHAAFHTGLTNALIGMADDGHTNMQVRLPVHLMPVCPDAFVLTECGPMDRDTFVGQFPHEFFAWWERAPDLARLAEAVVWQYFPWVGPLDDETRRIGEAVLAMTFGMDLPWRDEVKCVLGAASAVAPSPEGIGYLRGPMRVQAFGDWRLVVPGYFTFTQEEGALYWEFGERVIRFSSLVFEAPEGDAAPLPPDEKTAFEMEQDGLFYAAHFSDLTEEDGMHLHGTVQGAGVVAILTITFGDAADRDWALDVFKSVGLQPAAE